MKLIEFGGSDERRTRVTVCDSRDCFYVKASLTVEGSLVISLCILVIAAVILTGYDVFSDVLSFINNVTAKDYDGIRAFRLFSAGRDFVHILKGG